MGYKLSKLQIWKINANFHIGYIHIYGAGNKDILQSFHSLWHWQKVFDKPNPLSLSESISVDKAKI